jgi:IS30 family transposase
MNYKQLTLKERYHISALLKTGLRQKEIAEQIGVSPSTISRELRRNGEGKEYNPERAQTETFLRHRSKRKHTVWTPSIERYVRAKLKQEWSPEQISGRMRREREDGISHETIYRYVYTNKANGGRLYRHLRHRNRTYHKRGRHYARRGTLKNRTMIEKRPRVVETKRRIGDWEIDTVIGKGHQGILVTAVDRHSKFTLIAPAKSRHAEIVSNVLLRILEPVKPITKTITSDNGKEFAYHK